MRTTTGTRALVSNRNLVTSRVGIKNYPYSLRYSDDANRFISTPYHASYTTDIQSAFTILVFAKLKTRSNISNDTHAFVFNNSGVVTNNYYLLANSDAQVLTCFIANGVASDNLSSDASYGCDKWNWFGMSYQDGVGLDIIVNKTIKTKVPAITATMRNLTLNCGTSSNANLRPNGNIARIWILGGRITQAELNRVVDEGIKPPALTQALIYDMTQGAGGSVDDASPNSNTGTLVSLSWDSTEVPSKSRIVT